MIGTVVSASLVSLLGIVGATIIILVLILWMLVIISKISIVDFLSNLINEYKLEKEKHVQDMKNMREQREKEKPKIQEPPKYIQKYKRSQIYLLCHATLSNSLYFGAFFYPSEGFFWLYQTSRDPDL